MTHNPTPPADPGRFKRTGETAQLEAALSACRLALEEPILDRAPLVWARCQINLGSALLTLGEQSFGIDQLRDAAAAFGAALSLVTESNHYELWSIAKTRLAKTLDLIAARKDD